MRALFIIILLLLPACTATSLPTSERLEQVRLVKQEKLTRELAEQNLELGAPVFVRVFKKEEQLETWVKDPATGRYTPFKRYPICNYSGTLGPKLAEGDLQSPEGFYTVGASQMNPRSAFHLSFNLGFPNEFDRAHGRTGSLLMIHGDCKSTGCYALTDPAIEEVYLLVEASIAAGHEVPVHIFPFRMNAFNMYMHSGHEWELFWQNLKEGYDSFELTRVPPSVSHRNYKYAFRHAKQPAPLF